MKHVRTLFIYRLFALCCWLLTASLLPVSAQQTQDALYIFRNDGQFHAFFWSDIERFEYSKVDTLGVTHPDYVVQEVYALDSVFRIPITAIDSIAFVTPETQYKADVVRPDRTIADYIVASDSVYWIRLSPATPQSLIPKVGQKLLIEEPSRYIPDGFGGLVTSVTQSGSGYTVTTKELELTDVYDVLVLKSGGMAADDQPVNSRRRASDADFSFESPEPIELPALSATVSLLSGQYKTLPDDSPVQISLDGSLDFNGTLQSNVDLRCFLYLNTLCNQDRYYQIAKFDNTLDLSIGITGALTAHADVPFTFLKDIVKEGAKVAIKEAGKKLAVNMGPFWADLSFGLYFEGQGTLTSSYTWSNKHTINTTYQYDRNILWDTWEDFYHYSVYNDRDTTTWTLAAGKFALSTGLYAQAEVACNIPIVKKKGSVALRLDAGLKSEFDVPIFTDQAYLPVLDTPNLYKELNFDETVTFSTPVNLSFAANFGKWAWTPKLSFSLLKPKTFGVVPNISSLKWHDEKFEPYRFTVESPVTRSLLLPIYIGFAVFDIDDKQTEDFWYTDYLNDRVIKSYKHVFETLDPHKDEGTVYTVFPQIRYWGHPVLVGKGEEISIGKARIDISEKRITATEDRSHQTVNFVPNMKNVELKSDASWLTYIRIDDKGELTAYWEGLPANVPNRKATIFVTGKNKDGEVLVEDSIVVVQARLVFKTSPAKLSFDAKGGTQTVTITETNLTDITVSGNADYIKASISGKTITITVDPNYGAPYTSWVSLEGKLPTGDKGTATIDFSQDGNYDPGPTIGETLAVKQLYFNAKVKADAKITTDDKWYSMEAPSSWNLFYGLELTEEDIANGSLTVTATVVDNNTIHVECMGKKRGTDYISSPIYDNEPFPGMMCNHQLRFDIKKDSVYNEYLKKYSKVYRLYDVYYAEQDEYPSNTDENGSKKQGEISFNTPDKYRMEPFHTQNGYYAGMYDQLSTNAYGHSWSGQLDVKNYKFEYDEWSYDNWYHVVSHLHADYTYKPSNSEDLIFGIAFADEEAFSEWLMK